VNIFRVGILAERSQRFLMAADSLGGYVSRKSIKFTKSVDAADGS